MYAEYLMSPAYQAGEARAHAADRLGMAGIAIISLPAMIEGAAAGDAGNILRRGLTYAGMIAEGDFVLSSLTAPITGSDQSLLAQGIDSVVPGGHGAAIVTALNLALPGMALLSLGRTAMRRIRTIGPSFMRTNVALPTSGLNVIYRPGMEAGTIIDALDNPVTVFGQSTRGSSRTIGHSEGMDDIVSRMAATGEYEYFTVQRSWKTATGGASGSRMMPDVIGVRRDGRVDAWEVMSDTDDQAHLMQRLERGRATLPAERRGNIFVVPPLPMPILPRPR